MAMFPSPDGPLALALAIVGSSTIPLVLLDDNLNVVAASDNFWETFDLDRTRGLGRHLSQLGTGEWNAPRLRSLLNATAAGDAEIAVYEMELTGGRRGLRRLVMNACKLDYGEGRAVRLLLTINDVTDALEAWKLKDDLLRERSVLLQELQHRVANSLQIIASVLLQGARKVQSAESQDGLHHVHDPVTSVAAVQQNLARSHLGEVDIGPYLTRLCESLGASMIHDHNQLSLVVEADDCRCTSDVSISMGLIVTELTVNALKHAFPGGRQGRITVGYHAVGPNWTLSVQDDGVGMPTDPDSATPGLGTGIVEALAGQLKAQVHTEAANPGTRVSIVRTRIAAIDEDPAVRRGRAA